MGRDTAGRRALPRLERRSFLKAASVSTAAGAMAATGCLGRGRQPGTVVMTAASDVAGIMHSDGDELSIQQALWDAGLDEDIRVEIQTVVSDSAARMQTTQSALEAGRAPPDIHMMDSGWTVPFILRNQTVNLTEQLPDETLQYVTDTYLEASLEAARDPQSGDLHALPLFPDLGFTLYRQGEGATALGGVFGRHSRRERSGQSRLRVHDTGGRLRGAVLLYVQRGDDVVGRGVLRRGEQPVYRR